MQIKKKEDSQSEDLEKIVHDSNPKKAMNFDMFFNIENRQRVKKDNSGIENKDIISDNLNLKILKNFDTRETVERVVFQDRKKYGEMVANDKEHFEKEIKEESKKNRIDS